MEKIPVIEFMKNPFNTRGEIIGREEDKDFLVDTCFTNDTGKYETYIKSSNGKGVVEIYKNREEAIKGHKKWVKLIQGNPDFAPEDVGFEEWIGVK